jgi:hypothetical protein
MKNVWKTGMTDDFFCLPFFPAHALFYRLNFLARMFCPQKPAAKQLYDD